MLRDRPGHLLSIYWWPAILGLASVRSTAPHRARICSLVTASPASKPSMPPRPDPHPWALAMFGAVGGRGLPDTRPVDVGLLWVERLWASSRGAGVPNECHRAYADHPGIHSIGKTPLRGSCCDAGLAVLGPAEVDPVFDGRILLVIGTSSHCVATDARPISPNIYPQKVFEERWIVPVTKW
jgi:hypothetical protein